MKCFTKLGALAYFFFATLAGAEGEEAAAASDVVALKKDTFKDFIKSHPLVLAEFYAPWCGHCKALAPEYEAAATKLKEKEIPLVKVDCTEETDLCQEYEVQGYPTVKVFRGLDTPPTSYTGQRKSDSIISYMIKQSLPAVSILDKDTITDFKAADKVVLIAYLKSDDKASNETYTKVAESLRDNYLFGATSDAALAKEEGVTAPGVVMYKSFDEPKVVHSGTFDVEDISTFIKVASVPLIGEVGPETYSGYMQAGIPLAYLFVADEESKTKLSEAIRPVAEKYKGKINFATIDAVAYGAHAGNLNLEVGKWPAFAIQETTKNSKFPFEQTKDITKEAIEKFVKDFSEGKIEPSIKSEPIPEKQEGPVHVVVANNYKEVVIDNDKDVLLEFYAPWCGHCKNLAPKYEELAKLYHDNPEFKDKVLVAKVDATANDVPDDIQGFPTIKLYAKGKKDQPVEYSGSRTVEDMANFIKDNGSYKVDAYVPPPETEKKDEEVKEEVKEKTETAKEKAEEAAESATATATKIAEKVTEKVKEAAEAAKSVISDDDMDHDEL